MAPSATLPPSAGPASSTIPPDKVGTTLRKIDAAIRARDVETLQSLDGVMARATRVEEPIVEAINRHCASRVE